MSPAFHQFKSIQLKNEFLLRNNSNQNRLDLRLESMPDLQPVLEFDGCDEIDGNVISVDSNITNNNLNTDNNNEEIGANERDPLKSQPINGDCNRKNGFIPTQALVRKQAPTFLIIESLIWNICGSYEKERDKQKALYLSICERLEKYKIIGASYRSDSLQPIRDEILLRLGQLVSCIRSNDKHIKQVYVPPCSPNTNANVILNSHLINQSRSYDEIFEDLGLIEEGGFGIVNRAKHRFDNCEYAVKLIRFRYKSVRDFEKITREVQLYANLSSHPNVVAYKTAWLENWCLHQEKIPLSKRTEYQDEEMLSATEITTKTSNIVEDDVSIRFEESSKSGIRMERSQIRTETRTESYSITTEYNSIFSKNSQLNNDEDSEEDEIYDDDESDDFMNSNSDPGFNVSNDSDSGRQTVRIGRKKTISISSTKSQSDSAIEYGICKQVEKYEKPTIPDITIDYDPTECPFSCNNFGAVLYIQMELCGKNLKTWLRERNDKIFSDYQSSCRAGNSTNDILSHIDSKASLNIFRQVLKGVDFIHSQHLIHRDLKPQNILFSINESRVKIGDFGLATLHNIIDNEEISLHNYKRSTKADENNHTGGIGTSIYAAPEQKLGKNYDNSTDMYSLGIILFELFYPLSTDMEKVKCVSDITKNRMLPKKFLKRWPIVADIILKLTNPKPSLRPTASQVLQSSLFMNKEQQMIKVLEEELKTVKLDLEKKDREVNLLRTVMAFKDKAIVEKDNEIEKLRAQLQLMSNKLKASLLPVDS